MLFKEKCCNFVAVKRTLYFFVIWIATCSMMLSTMVMHHHHEGKVCLVEERCAEDGNINDEHTEHHENEQEGCRVHQMHHFIINAKMVKTIKKHILDGAQIVQGLPCLAMGLLPDEYGLVMARWQEFVEPLSHGAHGLKYRRGPPSVRFLS